MRISRKLVLQVVLFLIVGFTTFLIDLGVTAAFYHLLHFPAYLASAVGFLSGFFFNFPMNRKKVFNHSIHDKFSLKTQVVFFITLSILNLVITSGLVELMVYLGIDIGIAKFIVTGMIAVWNFVILKMIIFSKKESNSVNPEVRL